MSDDAPTTGPARIPNKGKLARDLNEVIRYTLWSVFKLRDVLPEDRAFPQRRRWDLRPHRRGPDQT